ncbi:isotrichodermin C-15 hydroxylase [Colletotrichum cuscutae]|uniref:Isotrichodermin C-15 hydroxylase n=1 Tax=Colletotrichum cuscutae TaxID=1209917 RepID=A0AAI9Y5C8_9PEZI|nr:isotrichodermin C-15 hydroxylase [Colletotrichum cuscutae]
MNTTEGFPKVYSATSPIDKSPFYQSFTPGFQSSFSSMGHAYKEKKSILSQAFAQKKLDAMEPAFMEHIWKLCEVMKSQAKVNLDDCLSALTVDILSDVCFGETFDLLHNPTEKANISDGRYTLEMAFVAAPNSKVLVQPYDAGLSSEDGDWRHDQTETESFGPTTGTPFPDRELFGEAIVMFVAGSDTTSTALLTILWHLLAHKDAYDKVALETEVGVINMAMHRDPKYFERPNDFIPERWIGDGQSAVKDKSAFSPFCKGPRACLGRTMTYMEMSIALAAMFLEMDMEFEDPGSEARQGYTATDSFVLVRPKVRIVVKSRR